MEKPKKEIFRKLIARAKKDASVFLNSEEGKILKKDVVRIALALGLVSIAVREGDARGHGSGHGSHSSRGRHSNSGRHASHASHVDTHSNSAHVNTPHVDSANVTLHNDIGTGRSGLIGGHSDSAHSDSGHVDSHANY